MASHRKPRPGGTPGAGVRTPALATAALTSLAVLSQTAETLPGAGHGRPSPEEVERKIDDLYRRADSATATAAVTEEPAGAPGRRADSLQRLRDEVARRAARARAVPTPRGSVPAPPAAAPTAQHHTTPAPDRAPSPSTQMGSPAPTTGAGVAAPAHGRAAVAPGWDGGVMAPAPVGTVAPLTHAAPAPVVNAVVRGEGVAVAPSGSSGPEVAARGPRDPKAVKAAVQRKLAHARVLLARRTVPGSAPSGTDAAKAGKAVAFARAQLGAPCVWGAAGPGSYDCSGLVQAAWKSAGVTLPRTAPGQAAAGTRVPPADARPGDLVLFHDDHRHVGLYTGDGMMIHAPRPGAYVREEPVSSVGTSAVHSVVRPV
ncbi:C40 family peptidase [Streptomyces sp. NPDC100445]|uniref:C40 family peptidase n=1 Tax=Streptomyces sp. NPDC100445 TaxID=3366102 RepID=UPI00382185A9